MLGLAVGIIAGIFQFWLLSKFTKSVTDGALTPSSVLLGILQFFLPVGILIGMAFLRRQELLWTGIGISGTLIGGALIKFLLRAHNKKNRRE